MNAGAFLLSYFVNIGHVSENSLHFGASDA
jgi:hypothetical protein